MDVIRYSYEEKKKFHTKAMKFSNEIIYRMCGELRNYFSHINNRERVTIWSSDAENDTDF